MEINKLLSAPVIYNLEHGDPTFNLNDIHFFKCDQDTALTRAKQIDGEKENLSSLIDLPFKTIWFECPGKEVSTYSLVNEISPEEQMVCMFLISKIHSEMIIFIIDNNHKLKMSHTVSKEGQEICMWQHNILVRLFKSLTKNNTTQVQQRTQIKIPQALIKNYHTSRIEFNSVIYIGTEAQIKKKHPNLKIVEKKYQYEVMGHWMNIKTISKKPGKDREGNRVIEGFTWVIPHTRGPEGAPLIKKTRVIKK